MRRMAVPFLFRFRGNKPPIQATSLAGGHGEQALEGHDTGKDIKTHGNDRSFASLVLLPVGHSLPPFVFAKTETLKLRPALLGAYGESERGPPPAVSTTIKRSLQPRMLSGRRLLFAAVNSGRKAEIVPPCFLSRGFLRTHWLFWACVSAPAYSREQSALESIPV